VTVLVSVVRVEVREPYRLWLAFDNGREGEVDIAAFVPFTGLFAPLRDPAVFAAVRVDPELHTIVWPTGADLDPNVLHEQATGSMP
jgi:hypothetical protein